MKTNIKEILYESNIVNVYTAEELSETEGCKEALTDACSKNPDIKSNLIELGILVASKSIAKEYNKKFKKVLERK